MGLFRRAKPKDPKPEPRYKRREECPLAGGHLRAHQEVIECLHRNQELALEREPHNRYDANAVAVYAFGERIGYVPRRLSAVVAKHMDAGGICEARVKELTMYFDDHDREKVGVIMLLGLTRLDGDEGASA